MNSRQAMMQLAWLLRTRTWTDSPNELVLASARVSAGVAASYAQADLKLPFCLIKPLGSTSDDCEPAFKNQKIEVILAVGHAGDRIGENALIGGQRPATTPEGGSKGRGLLEIEEEVLNTVNFLNQTNGVRMQVNSASAAEAAMVEGLGYVATRAYELDSWLTTARFYAPALRLTTTATGSGNVNLTWTNPAYRFDFHAANTTLPTDLSDAAARGGLILRRAAGATAPTSATAGTGVTLASAYTSVGVTDSPGVGQFSYALFVSYAEYATSFLRYSSSVTSTVTST